MTIKLWDIGGQPRFRSMWERYCRGVNAIVFIVDSADRSTFATAKTELHALLQKGQLASIPVLVLANKNDLPDHADVEGVIKELGLTPRARYVAGAAAGVEPSTMGLGPIPASRKVLAKAGLTPQRIDLAELNEAFAAQAIPCIDQIGLDPERVNVNGGAIAWGHPLGASGARLVLTLMIELQQRSNQFGLASMCIGVGQGIAVVVERA